LLSFSYNYSDIEKALQRKSWWAIVFILPFVRRLSLLIINRTNITPNTLTIAAFMFVPVAAYFYSSGTYVGLVLGAVFFEINYIFDCIDGTVARVKKLSSPIGAYIDQIFDRCRILILSLALAYGQYNATGNLDVVYLLMLYLGLNNLIHLSHTIQEKVLAQAGSSRLGMDLTRSSVDKGIVAWWLRQTQDRNIKPYYHDIEMDALVFVVGPLLNLVVPFLIVANILTLLLVGALNFLFLLSLKNAKGTSGNA
jgi:phosphatidylglycerophosphate synthase